MNISVAWLNRYLQPANVSPDEAERSLMDAGFPIESRETLEGGDVRLDVEITSNRGDCLSHVGQAREIAAKTGRTLVAPVTQLPNATGGPIASLLTIDNNEPAACPLFTARLIRGAGASARRLRRGLMPPHPAFYARTEVLRRAGGFDISYRRAADFDLMARLFHTPSFHAVHVPGIVTLMRLGGLSTKGLNATRAASVEILRSCRANGIDATLLSVLSRYPQKLREVVNGRLMRLTGWRPA